MRVHGGENRGGLWEEGGMLYQILCNGACIAEKPGSQVWLGFNAFSLHIITQKSIWHQNKGLMYKESYIRNTLNLKSYS